MTPRISVITPTCDRPFGVALMEKYIAAQTIQPDEWIVADGGQTPATLTLGQTHIHDPHPTGPGNLCNNLLRALEKVTGDIIIFVEDDDVYLPNHFARVVGMLKDRAITGSNTLNYYNIAVRKWITMHNIGSSLSQTAITRKSLPNLTRAIQMALDGNNAKVDNWLWMLAGCWNSTPESTVYGIKGLPGPNGLGVGHKPNDGRPWNDDPHWDKLREWLGELASPYIHATLSQPYG